MLSDRVVELAVKSSDSNSRYLKIFNSDSEHKMSYSKIETKLKKEKNREKFSPLSCRFGHRFPPKGFM